MIQHPKMHIPNPLPPSHPLRAVTLAFSNDWSKHLSLLLELPWAVCTEQADPDRLFSHEPLRAKPAVGDVWQLVSQSTKSCWMTVSICDFTEMVDEAKLPCSAVWRTSPLKENNRCSFLKKFPNPKHNIATQIHANEYLENKNGFCQPSQGVWMTNTKRRIYIFVIDISFLWWMPESMRHCLGMSHRAVLIAGAGCVWSRGKDEGRLPIPKARRTNEVGTR